jgi:DNA polymerase
MDRDIIYRELVAKRKAHVFPNGLLNPSQIEGGRFDSKHLGPWSQWQSDLHADAVIVGQDWGDNAYFLENKGMDSDKEQTCKNLRAMTLGAGWTIGTPQSPIPQRLFFTNAVLGIREKDGKSAATPAVWIDDSLPFLIRLLRIIQPRIVVSLGTIAYRACRLAMQGKERAIQIPMDAVLRQVRHLNPILRPGSPDWFAFYHCGPLGLVNRSRELQLQDWEQLGGWLRLSDH